MRKFKGLIYICVLAILSGTAYAQIQIVIDNQTIPTEHIESIVILPNSNLISVTTTVAYDVTPTMVGDDVVITSFTASSPITEGGDTTISWTTVNADSCAPSGGNAEWLAADIASIGLSSGSLPITVDNGPSITFTLTCEGTGGPAVDSVTVTVNAADAVAITSFIASPSTITEGGSTTLSWTTANADSCIPSGGNAAWLATNITLPGGNAAITVDNGPSVTFTLTCQGTAGPAIDSEIVTVNPDVALCDEPPLEGHVTEWQSAWSDPFPRPRNTAVDLSVLADEYRAIRFNTGDVVDSGQIFALENTFTPGLITGAFSQCPGDFDVVSSCYSKYRLGGSMIWSTDGSWGCQLEPNTTYYFNFTYTDGFDPATTRCGTTPCRATLLHRNY